ncbi:hypothetical protein PCG10_006703 [Penicillium crustosum]|uniref:Zn(2)-C6 fungal-type domain-containing protein n=1 Tax=Penicillium crustosum TaxID=36656 RepID=A0A9P5GN05_PENCR|nr:hypothetical protein PCG10_006703 [Penicillium crustosum]
MANGADILRPPSAPLSTTYSAQSTHPPGFPCMKCKAKHKRCDRTRPSCQSCQSLGFEAECIYPSVALPVTENKSAEDGITKKTGAPFSVPVFNNDSVLPTTGDKRPRATNSPSERTELVNDVVGSTIPHDFSHAQQTQIPQQPPAKRQKISELGSGAAAKRSALEQDQNTPFSTGMPSESRPAPPLRSISPTLPQDEMELRCNLTTEINVQRTKHRNLAAGPLRNIVKLLMKAKTERPTTEPTIAGSSATPLNNEWREEDDLMQNATIKLEKGGRCSRALLSRFENFLYGPLMSPEDKKMQERIICVEECLSSASAAPTSDHNHLFLHRLKRIIFNPDTYGLDKEDPRIGFLGAQLLAAIGANSKLSPSTRRKFAELLDPDGGITNVSTGSLGVKAETLISTRKVPPKSTSPRVPSSHTPETPSRATITHKENSVTSISLSITHPSLFPSRSSSSPTSPVERIHLTDATMPSSDPFIRPKRHVPSGRQSSQSSDTASLSIEPASKKRPASGGQFNDMAAPASKRAASRTQSSNPNKMTTPAPKRAPSGTQSSGRDNIIAPPHLRSPFNSEVPKKLWNIFLAKQAHFIPILDLDKLKVTFALALNHGNLEPKSIDPTLGLCLAIACVLIGDEDPSEPRKWYDAATSRIPVTLGSQSSLQYFHQQILRTQYLHMVGHLRLAWETLSLSIARAQPLRIQTMHGGRLAVDKQSLQQVRLVWQFLWMQKLSLTLQLGIVDQYLDTFYDLPMPLQSLIENNMGGDQSNRRLAAYSFFVASASLYKHTDQLITVENNLRVTRMECPIKWLSVVDLSGFQDLNRNLFSWNHGLPEFLKWKGYSIDLTLEEDLVIRRMSLVTHMRYNYFRLRQYRPFFVLCLRLSYSCTCEMTPHIAGKNVDSVNSDPFLSLVQDGAIKCIAAAQGIVKTLWTSFNQEDDEDSKFEQLDHLYAAALILIASHSFPIGWIQRVETGGTARSATTIRTQFCRAQGLLRMYEECCAMVPKLGRRIGRARSMLDQLNDVLMVSGGDSFPVIADNDVQLVRIIWHQLYDRLGLDVPFPRFPEDACSEDSTAAGRRLTFGWIESIPVDLDVVEK